MPKLIKVIYLTASQRSLFDTVCWTLFSVVKCVYLLIAVVFRRWENQVELIYVLKVEDEEICFRNREFAIIIHLLRSSFCYKYNCFVKTCLKRAFAYLFIYYVYTCHYFYSEFCENGIIQHATKQLMLFRF